MENEIITNNTRSAGKSYKEQQKFYRNLYKNRGRLVWLSKDPKNPIIKGRTYVKKNEEKEINNANGDIKNT